MTMPILYALMRLKWMCWYEMRHDLVGWLCIDMRL